MSYADEVRFAVCTGREKRAVALMGDLIRDIVNYAVNDGGNCVLTWGV